MRIIFSRKGFDSGAGGGPSPIAAGRPISLPIPADGDKSRTSYGDLGLGEYAANASRGRYGADALCHHDPMFLPDGTVILGQCRQSQSHLANRNVGVGDVFLFFGLFAEEDTGELHHRIFGYLGIEEIVPLGDADDATKARFLAIDHPHAIGMHANNDTLYVGEGRMAREAASQLRLTVPGGPVTMWRRPRWMKRGGISYFPDRDENWPKGRLYRVGNGQEFVAEIGQRKAPREWLMEIIARIAPEIQN